MIQLQGSAPRCDAISASECFAIMNIDEYVAKLTICTLQCLSYLWSDQLAHSTTPVPISVKRRL